MILIESIGRLHLQAGVTATRSFCNPDGAASIPLVKFQSRSFEEMPVHPTPASSRFQGMTRLSDDEEIFDFMTLIQGVLTS